MKKSPIFWTDIDQANERLRGTVILYDGDPYYVVEAYEGGKDNKPRLRMFSCTPGGNHKDPTFKLMDSPKFKRFRELPEVGWCNLVNQLTTKAVFLERGARRSRQHGLSDQNIVQHRFNADGILSSNERATFSNIIYLEGFKECVKGEFPSLPRILANITENSSIAYSRKYCVYRDSMGIRWLYRNTEKIGLFTGANTLNLVSKFAFYREEIEADPTFTLDLIQEF